MTIPDQSSLAVHNLWEDPSPRLPTNIVEPLLKWPGGKRYLIKHLSGLIPPSFGRYFEAFAGGAALFFSLCPGKARLTDTNTELINCYQQIRDCPQEVIDKLAIMQNSEQDYYRIRSQVPTDLSDKAARLIYLVTLSFNGIYRENRNGTFNVPYGYKAHINPCDPKKIHATSKALACAEILPLDFEAAVSDARAGDLVYLDPPYTVAHENNGFVKYNAKIFSWSDQLRLAKIAAQLSGRGCRVIVTNAAHSSISELYPDFTVVPVVRPSVIAAASRHRKPVTEYILHNGR